MWSATIPVLDSNTGQAYTAQQFKDAWTAVLPTGSNWIEVTRSTTFNAVMGYTYSVTFKGVGVGGRIPPFTTDTLQLTGVHPKILVTETVIGAQLQGSFQLSFNGYTTGALKFDSNETEVQSALNDLASIAPSQVTVSRTGPLLTSSSQVYSYVWSVTFNSNVWVDPAADHSQYTSGNWVGQSAMWSDVWDTGVSKAWGKNAGNQPMISCNAGSLFVTNGQLPSNGCLVEEVIAGTSPLSGTFILRLNTTGHSVINQQSVFATAPIAHNAPGSRVESGGDGSSVEEKLEALPNIGDVSVRRSSVNIFTGGYTWYVTFLRDKDSPGGQFGGCQQKDSLLGLCNSPGNVPKLNASELGLIGSCQSFYDVNPPYVCNRVTVLDATTLPDSPPGTKSTHLVYIDNPAFDLTFSSCTFKLTIGTSDTQCMSAKVSATDMQTRIMHDINTLTRPVKVSSWVDNINARNSLVYFIQYFNEGDPGTITVTDCNTCPSLNWRRNASVFSTGVASTLTRANAGVVDGVVTRGTISTFKITGESGYLSQSLAWNAPAEPVPNSTLYSVKTHLEHNGLHVVKVARTVVGQYGAMQYDVRFVRNSGSTPPGAGDVPDITVEQGAATNGVVYPPLVTETKKGSTGISGRFYIDLHSTSGPVVVNFDESPAKIKRKLELFVTVGEVYVTRSLYPNVTSGGWGEKAVADDSVGGYEYQIFFLRNPGVNTPYSFPPASGNIDPVKVIANSDTNVNYMNLLSGSAVSAHTITYVDGSSPLDGTFTLSYQNFTTQPVLYNEPAKSLKYIIEQLPSVGTVSATIRNRANVPVPGVLVTVARDGNMLLVEYTSEYASSASVCGDLSQCPWDVRQYVASGDLLQLRNPSENSYSQLAIDGAAYLGEVVVSPRSPCVTYTNPTQITRRLFPQEILRIGADDYEVLKSGIEVQVISVNCPDASSSCGNFKLTHVYSGVSASTDCMGRLTGGDMPSAAALTVLFDSLSNVNKGDVYVTRSTSIDSRSYVYSVYFTGPSVFGDVPTLLTSSCTSIAFPAATTSSKIAVLTVAQGSYTPVQTVRVNVESGYISGPLFQLSFQPTSGGKVYTTVCSQFGEAASLLQANLQMLPGLTDQLLPFTLSSTTLSDTYSASNSIFGILNVGDTLHVYKSDNSGSMYTVKVLLILAGQMSFTGDVAAVTTDSVGIAYLYHPEAVQVARFGTGNSTATVLSLTSTADGPVAVDNNGYYRIRMVFKGVEKESPVCLKHHATATDLQNFINGLGFDFSGDGVFNSNDNDHILVTRTGDGSVTSGYGYTYKLIFSGPILGTGRSSVMGYSQPVVQIIDEGYPRCSELANTISQSPIRLFRNSLLNLTTLVATVSTQRYAITSHLITIE